ncbi:MAG: isoaspartyl peptidase/L-asparaginase [Chlorobi bacterium]|nr:isoaspartyl peptidase/L-asparaginase [Chlorobiota bacterium]
MTKILKLLSLFLLALIFSCCENNIINDNPKWAIVIHGGAGTILKKNMSPEAEKAYKEKLSDALNAGCNILEDGGTSLDAVTAAINVMEDSPLFNAGKGAVFTAEGKNEMDASIMDGSNLMAGAVAGVSTVKNPILAARAVMEKSPHVMLAGEGADEFAKSHGLEIVDSSYFFTQRRWESYKRANKNKYGTVGAVALDKDGNLAAATSTGGMTNKMKGRIGDSPIIGAGTYADNKGCAVSATGHGEYFMRNVVAYDINALMKYSGVSLKEAANYVIMKKLKDQGGDGGIIAVDRAGNFVMTFNTTGMYRAYKNSAGFSEILIYKSDN